MKPMTEWFDIALPFICDVIPDEDLLKGVVRRGQPGPDLVGMRTVQIHRDSVGHIGLHQSWATPLGHEENTKAMKRMLAAGRLSGISLHAIEHRARNDPHVRFTITLPESAGGAEMSWYWFGDGTYDCFGADTMSTTSVQPEA